jgi:predicted neuraminidase
MVRISAQKHLLQPTLLMASERHWLALMRDQRPAGKVGAAETLDGGQTWADLPDLALINPDASIAGLTLHNGQMLLAHNSAPHPRQVLDLSGSANGRDWQLLQSLERGATPSEYSYPALAWADNSLWVSYTDQRRAITWQRFRVVAP